MARTACRTVPARIRRVHNFGYSDPVDRRAPPTRPLHQQALPCNQVCHRPGTRRHRTPRTATTVHLGPLRALYRIDALYGLRANETDNNAPGFCSQPALVSSSTPFLNLRTPHGTR